MIHAFKEAFYNYGSDLDFVVNFDILSIGDDIRISWCWLHEANFFM